LRGSGAEQCPGEQAVRAAVTARLGYDPFFPWARDTLLVEVTRDDGVFRTVVKLVDDTNRARGTRAITFAGDECAPVMDAMALTISLTIDPASVLGARTVPQVTTVPPNDPVRAPAPPPTAAPTTPAEPPRVRFRAPAEPSAHPRVSLGILGSLGATPAASVGFTLSGGIVWRWLSLDLEGRVDLPSSRNLPLASVSGWLLGASLVPCAHFGVLVACPVAMVGRLSATSDAVVSRSASSPWFGLGGRAGVEWGVWRRLVLRGYVEVLATPVRYTLDLNNAPAYPFPAVSGDLGVTTVWQF